MRAGDSDAYAVLVRRHAPVATRTAALFGAGADTDDVVQESFVKAYRSLSGFREGAPFRPWLLRIVANETKNLHRSAQRRSGREQAPTALPPSLLPGAAERSDPAQAALATEQQTALLSVLRELPERSRTVIVCRYLLDLDEQQTAKMLGLPRGTVKSRLHRALHLARERLEALDREEAIEE